MIKNLGEICAEKGYHATGYIYPVGYTCCIGQLPSLKRPGATTAFTTQIIRGEKGPLFQITCSDDREFKLSAKNPSKVWGQLKQMWLDLEEEQTAQKQSQQATLDGTIKPASNPTSAQTTPAPPSATNSKNNSKNASPTNSNKSTPTKKKGSGHGISGPQKIGLAHADIKRVIECMPNALKCVNYKFKFRLDKDESLTPKKAFKKTLKKKKDKNKDKNSKSSGVSPSAGSKKKKKKKGKSPKKSKKSKDKMNGVIINQINNVNNINIVNNVGNLNYMNQQNNQNVNHANGVHTITSAMSAAMSNMQQVHAMQPNVSNTMNNPIVIEDSPANVGNIIPALINTNNNNIASTNTSSTSSPLTAHRTPSINAMNMNVMQSKPGSEVIDLCDSEDDDIPNSNCNASTNTKKVNRKRKQPSSAEPSNNNNNAFSGANDVPAKKRRIDNKSSKSTAIWAQQK